MEIKDYQNWTDRTAIYPKDAGLTYTTLGLVGEAGEIANKVKKIIRDDKGILTPQRRTDLVDEVGDVMWYVTRLASELGVSMESVLTRNAQKLESRLEAGTLKGSGDNR